MNEMKVINFIKLIMFIKYFDQSIWKTQLLNFIWGLTISQARIVILLLFWVGGWWVGGWGKSILKTNSVQLRLKLGLSLATGRRFLYGYAKDSIVESYTDDESTYFYQKDQMKNIAAKRIQKWWSKILHKKFMNIWIHTQTLQLGVVQLKHSNLI